MTLCHIKASDLYNKICVRDLSAQTASAEVWMVMLEVSSDMEQPCKLAERTDLSALSSGAAFEFRTCPGPCLSYITHTLGLLSLTLVLRVDFPDRSWTCFIAVDFSGHLEFRAEHSCHAQPVPLTPLRCSGTGLAWWGHCPVGKGSTSPSLAAACWSAPFHMLLKAPGKK